VRTDALHTGHEHDRTPREKRPENASATYEHDLLRMLLPDRDHQSQDVREECDAGMDRKIKALLRWRARVPQRLTPAATARWRQ
jgi:hypothetical protein